MIHLLPDLTLVDGVLRSGVAVTLGHDGRIAAVGAPPEGAEITRLPRRVLLPGFVNGHSHTFQRAIRGRAEYRSSGRAQDDFWTWREEMYAAALRLTPEDVQAVAEMAFLEMALAGITTVGEFHYLHHPAEGGRYADPDELARRVIAAADSTGMRIVLLRVAYARGGHDRPLEARQVRFGDREPEEAIASIDRLASEGVRVGLAPHSVRAVPLAWLRTLGAAAAERRIPLHMHLSEQPREIEECVQEHGVRPTELVAREGLLDRRFTGVHGVHLTDAEIALLGDAGATICACPTTERNLGDGIVPAADLLRAGAAISFGTDSQIEIAPLQDARALEYHLRLQRLERAVLGDPAGDATPDGIASRLLGAATVAGARSLGVDAGRIAVGAEGDLVAIDRDDPSICGASVDTLLANLVFSMERAAIREVWIGGRQVVRGGRHPAQERVVATFEKTMQRLWAEG